jgi:uncharacterized membrane protein
MEQSTMTWTGKLKLKGGPVILAVALLFLGWLLNTPPGLLGKADAVGYAVCHRIELRSFHLGERPLPLCARCTGMYLGAILGLIYQSLLAPRGAGMPPRRVWIGVAGLVVAFGVDGLNSFLSLIPNLPTLYPPQNELRLLSGTGMGIAIAVTLFPVFNQSAWKSCSLAPAIGNLRALGGLLLLGLLLDGLVLSANSLLLYPLALLSAAGVPALLTLAYTTLLLILFHAENRYQNWQSLLLPLTGGFGLALAQIVLLDGLRYLLTGTWDGFHLG